MFFILLMKKMNSQQIFWVIRAGECSFSVLFKNKYHVGNNLLHISINRLIGKILYTIAIFKSIVHAIAQFEVGYTQ